MVYYEGLFFDKENEEKILLLEKSKLEVKIDLLHCTFKYLPKEWNGEDDEKMRFYISCGFSLRVDVCGLWQG